MPKESGECYEGPERRSHCEMVVALNQKFSDFLEVHSKMEKNVENLNKSMNKILIPYNIAFFFISASGLVFISESTKKLIAWLQSGLK